MSAEDAIFVTRALAGDRAAFEALVTGHLRRAQALARAVVHDEAAVDDVVQEAFLRAYRKLGSLSEPAHFPSWLGTIVRNEAITWLRRHARPTVAQVSEPAAPEPALPDPRLAALAAGLARLTPAQREIIALKYEAGLDYLQIAETLGLSVANVEKRLYRARQTLLTHLEGS